MFDDRRRMALLHGGLDLMVASARERAAMGARPEWHPVGSFGDRVAVHRVLWVGGPSDGPFEIEYFGVVECDESGLLTAIVLFDPEDARPAQREAWARWAAIEPEWAKPLEVIAGLADGFDDHDRAGIRALCDDDLVYHDRRRTGVGRIEGAEAAIASIEAYWNLAGDQQLELGWHWPAYGRHGGVTVVRRFGTLPDGGAFESEYLEIFAVRDGLATHLELFEPEDLPSALARFEELRPPTSRLRPTGPDPLLIPPNQATRLLQRIHEVRMSGSVEDLRKMVAEDFRFEDRKKQALVVGGVDEWVRALDLLWNEAGPRARREPIATAGERLALDRCWWREAPGEASFEIENYRLTEVDSGGKLHAMLLFDADDRAAASEALYERYFATGADGSPTAWFEPLRGWNEHDLARVRRALTDDFVLDDHRLAGMGRLEGPDAYVESVAALVELIPNARTDVLYYAAVGKDHRVSVNRTWGVNTEGGDVESFFVLSVRYREGKATHFEVFDVATIDEALARFEDTNAG